MDLLYSTVQYRITQYPAMAYLGKILNRSRYVYMHSWFTLMHSGKEHHFVNQ